MPRQIRVVIADDHALVREGIHVLLAAQPGLQVVGEAADAQEAYRAACELAPDVLLLDLSMPGVSGADTAERIAADCPSVRILALTMHEERGYVMRLLRAGAAGYVLKRAVSAELVRAIRTVAEGGTWVDPALAGALITDSVLTSGRRDSDSHVAGTQPKSDLTSRESEVLKLVARGHTNKEIAAALEIGVKTVESHKANAMAKLGLTSRAALVRFAMSAGWLQDA